MLLYGSRFSGGGLADVGAMQAGDIKPIWAIEGDPRNMKFSHKVADIYEQNIGAHVLRQPVGEVDPRTLEPIDILWDSLVCKSFSLSNTVDSGEKERDLSSAASSCDFIRVLRPKIYILENVPRYRTSVSFTNVVRQLEELGYIIHYTLIKALHFGVPQFRQRLILRAIRGDCFFRPALTGMVMKAKDMPYPAANEDTSWWHHTHDIINTLPSTHFTNWQLDRMKITVKRGILFIGGQGRSKRFLEVYKSKGSYIPGIHSTDQPAPTVVSGGCSDPRICIPDPERLHEPEWYLTGRILGMTGRFLARLQTVPDWYQLSGKMSIDATMLGNGVPCLMAQRIIEDTLGYIN